MATPQGYSGSSAIQMVRDNVDEPNVPADATILRFLNKGLEETVRIVGGPRLWAAYTTEVNQTTVQLNSDVEEILSANFSTGTTGGSASPFAQGALVYPMVALEQATFMDAAAGFPAVGFGPPQAYFVYQDQGTAPTTTLPVPDAPALSLVSGVSNGVAREVVLTYVNGSGETTASAAADYAPTAVQQGQVASPSSVSNATGYNAYVGAVDGPYHLQNATPVALGTLYTIPGTPLTNTATPPLANTASGAGTGGALWMQLYPAAMIGQVNVYYRARPQLWADTSSTSWTNLDTSAQEGAVLFATIRTLTNRGRGDEAKVLWEPQWLAMVGNGEDDIGSLRRTLNRRTVPRSGQVRDVTNRSYPNAPWWMPG